MNAERVIARVGYEGGDETFEVVHHHHRARRRLLRYYLKTSIKVCDKIASEIYHKFSFRTYVQIIKQTHARLACTKKKKKLEKKEIQS